MEPDADRALAEKAEALADAVGAMLAPWLVRIGGEVAAAAGRTLDADALADAADRSAADVLPRLRALLEADIDAQATTPLALLRESVGPVNDLLAAAGVPPPDRDEFARRALPDDAYDLAPAAFEDVDPALRGPGIEWGAAKAFVHLQRHRP